jgi:hypothetical protein
MRRHHLLVVASLFLALALAGCSSTQVAMNNAGTDDPVMIGSVPTEAALLPAEEEKPKPPRKPKKQRAVTITLQPHANEAATETVAAPAAAAAVPSAVTVKPNTGAVAAPNTVAAVQSAIGFQPTVTDAVTAPVAAAAFQSADADTVDPALEAGRERAARRSDEQMRKWDAIARRAIASVCRRC